MIETKLSRRTTMIGLIATGVAGGAAAIWSIPDAGAGGKGAINTIGSPGVAIKGYDPVAYFSEGRPVRGKATISVLHKGAEWHFSSERNRAAFVADPARYEPAYGGYCAYGVASGYLVKIEPEFWSIRNGRLYLNYDAGVQKTWSRSPGKYIGEANVRWPKLIGK